jgi:VCBS repeat-containing protein
MGRLHLTPTRPGLLDIQVTAIDQDGFSNTYIHSVRVKDPVDTQAPQLAWGGALQGATALGTPVTIGTLTQVQAALQEQQLMGYKLEIAPAGTAAWSTLAEQTSPAENIAAALALPSIDPALLHNGVYSLRLSAWDLVGSTTELNARIVIDSAQKNIATQTATDQTYTLGGHQFALTRMLEAGTQSSILDPQSSGFGNWTIPALDTKLTNDQPTFTAMGSTAPWQEGARVWLQIPANLADANAPIQNLSFTLGTTKETLGSAVGAPVVFHPVFGTSQGWTLEAHTSLDPQSSILNPDSLQRQGISLYDNNTGMPWVPVSYTLTAADGAAYQLDAAGKVTSVTFADGVQWLVTDAGIAAVTGSSGERVDFLRDPSTGSGQAGRIVRVVGTQASRLQADGTPAIPEQIATAYKYDAQGRLILARTIGTADLGTPYGYQANGLAYTDTITANFGAAVSWTSTATANQWQGTLVAGQTTTLAFSVRDSEIASTVHTPGAQGAVIVAIETIGTDAALEITGATVIGTATQGQTTTTLVRLTEAGLKLLRLSGSGTAQIKVSLAGDMNRDGLVNGADSAAWEAMLAAVNMAGDINGDGAVNTTDRQVLYANYGLRANQAPVAASVLPGAKTHTDLATNVGLNTVAQDMEGDSAFWRVLGSTHGTAKLSSDGLNILFTPEAGYAGLATITVQADDGFASAAPIELSVNVSGAKLLALHLAPLSMLRAGESAVLHATADFEDEKGVAIVDGGYLTVSLPSPASGGGAGGEGLWDNARSAISIDDARDLLIARAQGPALVIVTRTDASGHTVQAVNSLNAELPADPNADYAADPMQVQPDVYPGTLTLVPGGTRQLKVHLLDPDTGAQTNIGTAAQTSDITVLDAQGQPVLDATTGLPVTTPAVTSATRYYSSDETIATVDANGLITAHQTGKVTISVVHLETPVVTDYIIGTDPVTGQPTYTPIYRMGTESVIGQSDIALNVQAAQLTDTDPTTVTPQAITVSAQDGAAVSADTGETVLIGAGALNADTAVSISRINVADLAALGMPAPAPGALQGIGAFTLDIGAMATKYPLQLAIPVQGGVSAQPGEEVFFFRKGSVLTQDGTCKDSWWLVDNGYVGTDGVARTASPPYGGLSDSGEYFVATRLPGLIGGTFDLVLAAGDSLTFDGLTGMAVTIGGGLMGMNVTSEMIGIFATMSGTATAASYHFGVPQFATVTFPPATVDTIYSFDSSQVLPPAVTPYGNVSLPSIGNAVVNEANGTITLTISNDAPGQFAGSIEVRVLYPDGTYEVVQTLSGDTTGDITVSPPSGVALASVSWQVVRLIPTGIFTNSGELSSGEPLEFAGNVARINAKPDMAVVLTRTGIDLYRQNKLVGHTSLLMDNNQSITLPYLLGSKVQPVVFSEDLSTIFVGGTGAVYAIDALTFKLINTINVPAGRNISSLVSTGHTLIIGEGQNLGSGAGCRLLAMNIRPGSREYGHVISFQGTGIETSAHGVAGMAIGLDGKTLVVSTPINANSVSLGDRNKRGDVLVFDLSTLDFNTGRIAAPTRAELPADGFSGKSPQTITATKDSDRFLVANVADYNRGLSTLVLTRDASGKITGAKLTSIEMAQPSSAVRIDRLDIQRAQSAVLVTVNGVEYAIVSDDNYYFNDPYWKAMYETPHFIFAPSGPPMAVGGSATAKKVNVGGKLGIVKDPFGAAQYLGATLPLDGYGIVNLSLSEDGKALIGQLKGGYSANLYDSMQQKPSQSHVWDVNAIITAALGLSEGDRMSKHIVLPPTAEQLVENNTSIVAGTYFDPEFVRVATVGNMGDVIGVNLRDLAARQLLVKEGRLDAQFLTKAWKDLDANTQHVIITRMDQLKDFSVSADDLAYLSGQNPNDSKPALKLIVDDNKKPVSRAFEDPTCTAEDDFSHSGVLFFVPVIKDGTNGGTVNEEALLRLGKVLTDKNIGFFFHFTDTANPDSANHPNEDSGFASVTAKDFATSPNVFFGDRPLDNPGYSAFELKGGVGAGQLNDLLDVYRVEQRLRYLGFPAMHTGTGNTLKDFAVNGEFKAEEAAALKLFEKVVRYENSGNSSYFSRNSLGADGVIEADTNSGQGKITIDYLNAYNAPHWMDIGAQMDYKGGRTSLYSSNPGGGAIANWNNSQYGSNAEQYGTSWMRDLMVASNFAPEEMRGSLTTAPYASPTYVPRVFLFNGSVDANLAYTPKNVAASTGHWTHDLGMAFDLGVSQYISQTQQHIQNEKLTIGSTSPLLDSNLHTIRFNPADPLDTTTLYDHIPDQVAYEAKLWSYDNAMYLTGLLPAIQSPARFMNDQVSALRDALSLYAVVRSNTLNTLNMTSDKNAGEEARIRKALFGDGTQAGALISKILIGSPDANTYPNMHEVLQRLGIADDYDLQHHFHIYLNPPDAETIGTQNLLADTFATNSDTPLSSTLLQTAAHGLLDYAQNITTGEELMFTMDVPSVPAQQAPIVLVQAAAPATAQPNYIFKFCTETLSTGDQISDMQIVDPAGMLAVYLGNNSDRNILNNRTKMASIKITLLQGTTHGELIVDNADELTSYVYEAIPNYVGNDNAIFMAEFEGKRYKIIVELHVFDVAPMENHPTSCPPPQLIKVNGKPVSGSSSYDLNTIPVTFSDLSGSALGQTNANGITLDSNASGYNWFIDTTPADNSEFLPTSNPNEWVAKEGSAAYGKMDMLSVLLHEYGHALGINHSADSHDYMATTLTAGVRRLPSAAEMALMQQLVGQVKATFAESTPSPSLPLQGGGGFPTLPLGANFIGFLGLLRSSRYGGMSIAPDASTLVTKYAVAANATLTNGSLLAADGWATQGGVDIGPSTSSGRTGMGEATLYEVSGSQTRLSQVFMVNDRDRFLSFTLAGTALDNLTGAPDDAFEVALLDANSGASLLGGTGLTRSDAFLNLQADGTQNAANCVTCINNADGSRTYRVDLAGIAAGTAVNLSFDLIGFGGNGSHVTVSDVRLSGLPQLHDEVATLLEDGALAFNPFAQVDNAALLQLGSHVVDQPAHGAVVVNADGTFSYTPATDHFGTDTFTYRLSDGPLESNLATVSLTITPVNDAPVVADVQATTAEDTALVIALGAYATDVDSTALTTQIVAGPAHGVLTQNADGSYTYTPDANYNGADSFTYLANDGLLDSNIATVSLNVTAVNDAPTLGDINLAAVEDTALAMNLLATASDIDGDTLTASIVAGAQHGQVSINADGSFTYTPDLNFNGVDSFTYKVNDGPSTGSGQAPSTGSGLDSNIATVILNVAAVNDAPVAADAAVTTLEDTALVIDLIAYATDVETPSPQPSPAGGRGGFSARIVTGPAHGVLTQNADSTFSYLADANYNGADSFTYLVNDGALDSNIATVTLAITAVNDAPTLGDLNFAAVEDTALAMNLLAQATDIEGDPLTAVVVAGPLHGQISVNADGSFTYTPELNYNGADSFTYKVNDGALDSNIATVMLSIAAVNDAPVVADAAMATLEDTALVIDLRTYATDVDSSTFTARIVTGPAHGALAQNADGTFSYIADANYNGADSFTYLVNDGQLDSNVATVTLAIASVNDAPQGANATVTTLEDTPYIFQVADFGFTDAMDAGSNAGANNFANVIVNSLPQAGTLTNNGVAVMAGQSISVADIAAGLLRFTPAANANSAAYATFTFQVQDDGGVANGGINTDPIAKTLTLDVTSVNDAPLGTSTTVTTLEDMPYVFQAADFGFSDAIDAGSTAGANHFANVIIGALPMAGSLMLNGVAVTSGQSIAVADIAAGLLQLAPAANANGAGYANFTFQVQDDGGVANGGINTDQTARTMTIDVTAVNDAPVAVDMQAAGLEDVPLNLNLLATASDVDGDVLTPVIVAGPLHGQLLRNADGTFDYLSDLNYFGTDSFTYKVNDGQLDSNIVTVSLTVAAVNDAPVALSAMVAGLEDTPYIFTWSDFRVSDVDSTGLGITINTLPADGVMQLFDGLSWNNVTAGQRVSKTDIDACLLCFNPDANESGFEGYSATGIGNNLQNYASFTYQADDGFLSSAVASMTVNITPVVDAPSLSLTALAGASGATATRFSTSWESAPNRNRTSTVLHHGVDEPRGMLEGWNVVKEAKHDDDHHHDNDHHSDDKGQGAFILWSSGDKMLHAKQDLDRHTDDKDRDRDDHKPYAIVQAAAGNGNNWLELGDAMGMGHQTYGIERAVETRAGISYRLSLDYAGRLGYDMAHTRIGIYVDGVQIGTHASTGGTTSQSTRLSNDDSQVAGYSPNTALNWETLTFNFTGNGTMQNIRIVMEKNGRNDNPLSNSDGTTSHSTSPANNAGQVAGYLPQAGERANEKGNVRFSAMIDDIVLTEVMPINTGYQDGPIRLSGVLAALTDTDGSEALEVTVGAIPTGAVLSDGTNSFTATDSLHLVAVTGWNLANLSITAPIGFTGSFALTIAASATETATGETANYAVSLPVTVVAPIVELPLIAEHEHHGHHHEQHHEHHDEHDEAAGDKCGDDTDVLRQADGTTDMTTSHLTRLSNDDSQVIGYSHSTKLSENDSQVAGYQDERSSSATVTLHSEHTQSKPILGFPISGLSTNDSYGDQGKRGQREQSKPITDWSAGSSILDDESRKGSKAKPTNNWLSDFLGVDKSAATKQDAASLTKLVVTLDKGDAKGR